ncbi:hypothetical protein [Actinophytocola xanthii]|uniref:hypothetical protein n=1 Tax=Actinophytocola xanthii TaxID=1912961 RepID=UPI001177EE4D|nr:hypothetical protein [Actinophytocola xanthii]
MDRPSSLAFTGLPMTQLLLAGAALLLLGIILAIAARRRRRTRRRPGAMLSLVIITCAAGALLWADTSAHAAGGDCDTPTPAGETHALELSQTSVLSGLAPGVAPAPITGNVENTGTEPVVVTAVTVSITSVVKAADAVAGTCDDSDYLLVAPRMPVGKTLKAGETAEFSGAALGFTDKSTNQDACKGARVDLRYTAS